MSVPRVHPPQRTMHIVAVILIACALGYLAWVWRRTH
jgi:hypothetical protein